MDPKEKYDVIIIGSGSGGLSCGIKLAKSGKKVLIIDKNSKPGGCAAWFERNGIHFEAAAHFLSGLAEGGGFQKCLKELEIYDDIEFIRVGPPYQNIGKDINFTIWDDKKKCIDEMKRVFPNEKENIDKYIMTIENVAVDQAKMKGKISPFDPWWKKLFFYSTFPFKYPNVVKYNKQSIEEVHKKFFKDKRLSTMLNVFVYPGMSFVYYAGFWNMIWKKDISQPKGGMKTIINAMTNKFSEYGGDLLLKTKVDQILVENSVVRGVKLSDGKIIKANLVVSNADAKTTYLKLIGEEYLKRSFLNKLKKNKVSEALFLVYIATDIDISKLNFTSCQLNYLPTYDLATAEDVQGNPDLIKNSWISFVFDTVVQPEFAPPGIHIFKIGRWMPYNYMNNWQTNQDGKRGEKYRQLKEKVANLFIKYAEDVIPDLSKHIIVKETATPLTFENYTGNSEGATAGFSWNAQTQFKLKQKTPIRNLYQVGHWSWTPGGFVTSMLTGIMASKYIQIDEEKKYGKAFID